MQTTVESAGLSVAPTDPSPVAVFLRVGAHSGVGAGEEFVLVADLTVGGALGEGPSPSPSPSPPPSPSAASACSLVFGYTGPNSFFTVGYERFTRTWRLDLVTYGGKRGPTTTTTAASGVSAPAGTISPVPPPPKWDRVPVVENISQAPDASIFPGRLYAVRMKTFPALGGTQTRVLLSCDTRPVLDSLLPVDIPTLRMGRVGVAVQSARLEFAGFTVGPGRPTAAGAAGASAGRRGISSAGSGKKLLGGIGGGGAGAGGDVISSPPRWPHCPPTLSPLRGGGQAASAVPVPAVSSPSRAPALYETSGGGGVPTLVRDTRLQSGVGGPRSSGPSPR